MAEPNISNQSTLVVQPANVLEAIKPFKPDDSLKGTFLVLRIAGMERATALRQVHRSFNSYKHWRNIDKDFRRVDDSIPVFAGKFAGEARVVRTALLDISIIEAAIMVFREILTGKPVSGDKWNYAMKIAGIRMPVMDGREKSASPWESMANAIKNTLVQKELVVESITADSAKRITAREIPLEQTNPLLDKIVQNTLEKYQQEEQGGNIPADN